VGLIGNRSDQVMNLAAFKRSLSGKKPPPDLSAAVRALWWSGKDDWEKAHKIVMDEGGADCAWVHGYLHRVEGDLGNAGYWYRQARRGEATGSLEMEWSAIAVALLAGSKN
jgi:hypothetical protein